MPQVEFARSLTRHVACPAQQVQASTLRQAFDQAFLAAPALRHYVLDEQACVRKHVAVFINAQMITSRDQLDVPLGPQDKVLVVQALSGG